MRCAGRRERLALLVLVTTAISCSSDYPLVEAAGDVLALTGVSIDAAPTTLELGTSVRLRATVLGVEQENVPEGVRWVSTNPTVATVDESGVLTSVGLGSVQVVASLGFYADTADIEVTPPPLDLRLVPEAVKLAEGDTVRLDAIVSMDGENVNQVVQWTSGDTTVATVDAQGVVTGLVAGSVDVEARTKGAVARTKIAVFADPVEDVSILPATAALGVGEVETLVADVRTVSGRSLKSRNARWSTSDSSIVSVDPHGRITAHARGSADVVATVAGKTGKARVNVAPSTTIAVVLNASHIDVGSLTQAKAVVRLRNGEVLKNVPVAWSSSDDSRATVSKSGMVHALSPGPVSIVAASGSAIGSAKLTIVGEIPSATPKVELNLNPDQIGTGQTSIAKVAVYDESGKELEGQSVSFTSSNPKVATITPSGVITGVAAGTSSITAATKGVSSTEPLVVTAGSVLDRIATIDISVPTTTLSVGDSASATATAYDASGSVIPVPMSWRSLNKSIIEVGPSGKFYALRVGSASIEARAVKDGVRGKSSIIGITIKATGGSSTVASVSVSVAETSLSIGQSTQATAIAKDASGKALSGRTFDFSSSNTSIATVSSSGLVTAKAPGTATVTASTNGKSGSVAVNVQGGPAPKVASVSVAVGSSNLVIGQTTTAVATVKDAGGVVLSGQAIVWASSSAAVASIAPSGQITAIAPGSATLTGTVGGISGSAKVTVGTPSGGGSGGQASNKASRPNLPTSFVDIGWKAPTGSTISVSAGGNLQQALNNAKPGDEIVLAAGATFTGNYTLPTKSGNGWILVRTSGSVPGQGTRLTRSNKGGVARIVTDNQLPALQTKPGTRGWRFVGIEFTVASSVSALTAIVSLGDGGPQKSLSDVPSNLVFDRVWVHGHSSVNVRRCIALNSASTAVINSTIDECHDRGFDAQAIWGWNGPGPFHVENNYLEGSGENFGFGGAPPSIPNLVPSDIVLRRNHIAKPASWKNAGWLVKNLIEFKNARRVLIEENLIEGNWANGQQGYALMITARSEGGACRAWCVVEDVTFRWNHVRRTGSGLNLSGRADPDLVRPSTRFLFEHNLWDEINSGVYSGQGRIWMLQSTGLADVTFSHNTAFGTDMTVLFCDRISRVEIEDNILSSSPGYGLWSCIGQATGIVATNHHVQDWSYLRNITINVPSGPQPPGNFYTTLTAVRFVNPSAKDWALSSSSPFKGVGERGTDPGVDMATLKSKLSGVVVP